MTKPETSWIVPFLGDLREYARDNGLDDFARDIEKLIATYGPVLGNRERQASPEQHIEADLAALSAEGARKPH